MNVISVLCRADQRLHLAPFEHRLGTSVFTLCLERWAKHEKARVGTKLCPECFEKWKEKFQSGNQPQEQTE